MARKRPTKDLNVEKQSEARVSPGQIGAWVRGMLLEECPRIDLKHITEDGMSHVRRWNLLGDDADANLNDSEALTHEIMTAAQDEAQAFGGRQMFSVQAFDVQGQAVGRRSFAVTSEGEATDDIAPSESASAKGITAQLMRHLEQIQRNASGQMADILGHYQLQNRALAEELNLRRRRDIEEIEMRERLASGLHEREIEIMRETRAERIQGELIEKVTGFLPVIAGKLLAKPGERPDPMFGEEIISGFVKFLMENPDKAAQVAAIVGPEKAAQIGELAKMYILRDAAKAEAEEKRRQGESSGKVLPIKGGK